MSTKVRYAFSSPTDLLVDAEGYPIIPVASQTELEFLKKIVELHACELTEVRPDPAALRRASDRRGSVIAVGREAEPAGALYAHLTGREFRQIDDLEALPPGMEVAVVVLTTVRIDHALMLRLYGRDLRSQQAAPGLIATFLASDLAVAAKRWAAALICAQGPTNGRTFLFPSLNFSRVERAEGVFIGGEASASTITKALSAGSSILTMNIHANGLDVTVRDDLHICPLPLEHKTDARHRPLCLDTGRCTMIRNMPSRDEAWQRGKLVGFSALRAQLLIMLDCEVVRLAGCLVEYDPVFNITQQFALESIVGACITTWRMEHVDRHGLTINPLVNALSASQPVGIALKEFNCAGPSGRPQLSLCLLGDPDYKIAPLSDLGTLPTRRVPSAAGPEIGRSRRAAEIAQVALMNALVREAPGRCEMRPFGRREELEVALQRLNLALLATRSETEVDRYWMDVSDLMVDFIACSPWIEQLLVPFGQRSPEEHSRVCDICGGLARSYLFQFYLRLVRDLDITICDACGTYTVNSKGSDWLISFPELQNGKRILCAPSFKGSARVCIISASWRYSIWPDAPHASVTLPWPVDENGILATTFTMPAVLPMGPLHCHVILAGRGTLEMRAIRLKRSDDETTAKAAIPCRGETQDSV